MVSGLIHTKVLHLRNSREFVNRVCTRQYILQNTIESYLDWYWQEESSGTVCIPRWYRLSCYCRPRSSTEVVSRSIDTDGYGACIRTDTDLRKLNGVRHLLHFMQWLFLDILSLSAVKINWKKFFWSKSGNQLNFIAPCVNIQLISNYNEIITLYHVYNEI